MIDLNVHIMIDLNVHGVGFVICNENKIILKTKIRFRTNLKLELNKKSGS